MRATANEGRWGRLALALGRVPGGPEEGPLLTLSHRVLLDPREVKISLLLQNSGARDATPVRHLPSLGPTSGCPASLPSRLRPAGRFLPSFPSRDGGQAVAVLRARLLLSLVIG